MVISYGFISSIYMYLYVFIMVIPWFILFYTMVLLRFYHGLYYDSPILPSNAAEPQDSVLLIRIATNREKEEHEPNGEDRRRANPTRQVPRCLFWGVGWGVFCFFCPEMVV